MRETGPDRDAVRGFLRVLPEIRSSDVESCVLLGRYFRARLDHFHETVNALDVIVEVSAVRS